MGCCASWRGANHPAQQSAREIGDEDIELSDRRFAGTITEATNVLLLEIALRRWRQIADTLPRSGHVPSRTPQMAAAAGALRDALYQDRLCELARGAPFRPEALHGLAFAPP